MLELKSFAIEKIEPGDGAILSTDLATITVSFSALDEASVRQTARLTVRIPVAAADTIEEIRARALARARRVLRLAKNSIDDLGLQGLLRLPRKVSPVSRPRT